MCVGPFVSCEVAPLVEELHVCWCGRPPTASMCQNDDALRLVVPPRSEAMNRARCCGGTQRSRLFHDHCRSVAATPFYGTASLPRQSKAVVLTRRRLLEVRLGGEMTYLIEADAKIESEAERKAA
jgi:hypothetical protein